MVNEISSAKEIKETFKEFSCLLVTLTLFLKSSRKTELGNVVVSGWGNILKSCFQNILLRSFNLRLLYDVVVGLIMKKVGNFCYSYECQ